MTAVREVFRERIRQPGIITIPGAADALTARIIEESGFEAVYATGAGFANASFGLPDVGLVSLTELREHVRRLTAAVSVPVIVDADTGFGGVLNVHRTVSELEHVGVAAIQLEDQRLPKRCGHFDGKRLVTVAEMKGRIEAALDARSDENLIIIARTDAFHDEGLEGAIERALAYSAAGADMLFVEAPTSRESLEQLPTRLDSPLIANMVEGGKTPMIATSELEAMGFKVALYANTALRAAMHAVQSAMDVLKEDGDTSRLMDAMLSWDERQRLVGLPAMQELEARLHSTMIRPDTSNQPQDARAEGE